MSKRVRIVFEYEEDIEEELPIGGYGSIDKDNPKVKELMGRLPLKHLKIEDLEIVAVHQRGEGDLSAWQTKYWRG